MKIDNTRDAELRQITRFAELLDTQFRLPGTSFRFGLDPIIGLIPVLGDLTTLVMSISLVYMMAKYGTSGKVKIMMIGNVLIDTIISSIPIIGQVLDFSYKSNVKNLNLLKKHYKEGKYQGSGKGIIAMIIIAFLVLFSLIIYGSYRFIAFLYHYFSHSGSYFFT